MELKLERCTVRDWRMEDVPSIVKHAPHRNVSRNLRDRFAYPYTIENANEFLTRSTSKEPRNNFCIEIDGAAVGGIGVHIGEDVYRHAASIGYWLGEEFWGRGIATDALIAVTEYAFSSHDLCRLYAHVFEWNHASARVLEKAGYQLEGRQRKSVTKEGQTIDQLMYATIR